MVCHPAVPTGHIDHVGTEVPLTVTKLLDRAQWKDDSKAIEAVRLEGRKLVEAGTWDEGSVIEKDDLIAQAKKSGQRIHLGQLMTICSIKFAELSEEHHKHKGRVVFRGDIVRDEYGAVAVFQMLSAQPTSIAAANANISYGCLPGNKTTQADAVQA